MKTIVTSILACAIFLGLGNFVHAQSEDESWDKIINLSSKIYEYTSNKNYDLANQYLKQFDEALNSLKNGETNLTSTDLHALSTSEEELQTLFKANSDNDLEMRQTALQLRLITDALGSDGEPLWKSLKNSFLDSFNKVQADITKRDRENYQYDLNQFMSLYQTIYPSLVVDVKPNRLEKIDQEVSQLFDSRMTTFQNKNNVNSDELQKIGKDLNGLFNNHIIISSSPEKSVVWVMGILGSFVLITLIYVTLRKYRGAHSNTPMV